MMPNALIQPMSDSSRHRNPVRAKRTANNYTQANQTQLTQSKI